MEQHQHRYRGKNDQVLEQIDAADVAAHQHIIPGHGLRPLRGVGDGAGGGAVRQYGGRGCQRRQQEQEQQIPPEAYLGPAVKGEQPVYQQRAPKGKADADMPGGVASVQKIAHGHNGHIEQHRRQHRHPEDQPHTHPAVLQPGGAQQQDTCRKAGKKQVLITLRLKRRTHKGKLIPQIINGQKKGRGVRQTYAAMLIHEHSPPLAEATSRRIRSKKAFLRASSTGP